MQTGAVADIEIQVKGLVDVVAPVGAAMEAAVGRRVPGAPGRLAGFQGKAHAVGLHLIAQGVEHMVFVFRPDDHLVRDAGLLHVGHSPAGHIAGILGKGAVVGLLDHHHVPYEGQGGDLCIRVHNAGGQVWDEYHIAVVHHGIAVVGAVKADAVLHNALVQPLRRDGEMPPTAIQICELEIHHLDAVLLNELPCLLDALEHT